MATHTGFYDLLGVAPSATEDEIKRAYKKRAMRVHPDKNPNDPQAAQTFQELQSAYSTLIDAEQRATYDRHGPEGLKRGGGGASDFSGMDDVFSQFFSFPMGGGGGGPRRRSNRRGEDSVIAYEVILEDLYNGKTAHFNLERNVLCSHCEGSGGRSKAKPAACPKCNATGVIHITRPIGRNQMGMSQATCPDCSGEGQRFREKDRCKKCKGKKTTKAKKAVDLVVEQGMTHGQRIVMKGEGDQQPGVPTGDVIFVLRMEPHSSMHRAPATRSVGVSPSQAASDLYTTVHITLSEALLGFSRVILRHMDGRGLNMSRQHSTTNSEGTGQGLPVKHGDVVMIRGEGMPIHGTSKGRSKTPEKGDLYVRFQIEMPTAEWLSGIDSKALEALLPPKKPELSPRPDKVDDVRWAAADLDALDEEDEWEDEDEDPNNNERQRHHHHHHHRYRGHEHRFSSDAYDLDLDEEEEEDLDFGDEDEDGPFGGGAGFRFAAGGGGTQDDMPPECTHQ